VDYAQRSLLATECKKHGHWLKQLGELRPRLT